MDIKITMTDNNSNRMVKHSGQVFTPDFLVISILYQNQSMTPP